MAGGTHVFDMIKRLRENENLRKKNYFKKSRATYSRTSNAINLDYKTATEKERLEIRNHIIRLRKRETSKSIAIFIVSIIVTGLLIILVLSFI